MGTSAPDGSEITLAGRVILHGADDHPYAAERLRAVLDEVEWVEPAQAAAAPGGSTVRLSLDGDLPEGAFRIDASETDEGAVVDLAGGPVSGVIQAVEALLRGHGPGTSALTLRAGRLERSPSLAYRMLWTWDHSTHWDVEAIGLQETGAFNPYMKQPEGFIADYERMVDFASREGVGGIVIYGLLRDSHGGVEAANHVCRYARHRGVRILAGVAINSYGGIYYEGDHPYNLATWLREHPYLAVDTASLPGFTIDDYGYLSFPRGDYTLASRSDRAEMERWHLEGLEWLLETVEVHGINLEFGDYAGNDAMADMRRLLPGLLDTAHGTRDDLWLVTELEWDLIAEAEAPERVTGLPDGCGYQFTYNRSYWPRLHSRLERSMVDALPTSRNLIRPHAGSQWNRQRYAYMAPHYADLARLASRTGLDGATIFGEVSDYSVPNELSYLAYARFTSDADLSWERFVAEEVEPRLGGDEAARRFVELLEKLDADDLDASASTRALEEVRATAASLTDPARRRWTWLEERLARRIHARTSR